VPPSSNARRASSPSMATMLIAGSPAGGSFPMGLPAGGPPTLADVLPPMFQFILNLTPEQKTTLDETQKEVVGKLENHDLTVAAA
jgi:hypothetical protein